MQYNKNPLTYDEQAELILSRGLKADKNLLIAKLKDVNFYRLYKYLHPYYNKETCKFNANITFENVWEEYIFDRKLRLVVMDAIERVEVSLRTKLAYLFSHKYGAFGYLDKNNLPELTPERYTEWRNKLKTEETRSREPLILDFKKKYTGTPNLPIWVLVEIMSFGELVTFFIGADNSIKQEIRKQYNVQGRKVLKSWILALNTVRNICAHHSRLWNKPLTSKPIIPSHNADWHTPVAINNSSVFTILTILLYLLKNCAPETSWKKRLLALIEQYPNINLAKMGFPENWQKNNIWSIQ